MQFRQRNRKEHPIFDLGPPWFTFTTLETSSRDQRSKEPFQLWDDIVSWGFCFGFNRAYGASIFAWGPFKVAEGYDKLKEMKISHIVSVAAEGPPQFPEEYTYLHFPFQETSCTAKEVCGALNDCFWFITNALDGENSKNNRVLVHCNQGIQKQNFPDTKSSCVILWEKLAETLYSIFEQNKSFDDISLMLKFGIFCQFSEKEWKI